MTPPSGSFQLYYVPAMSESGQHEWRPTTKVSDLFALDASEYVEFDLPYDDCVTRLSIDLSSVFAHFSDLEAFPGLSRYQPLRQCGDTAYSWPRQYSSSQMIERDPDLTAFPFFQRRTHIHINQSENIPGTPNSTIPVSSILEAARSGEPVELVHGLRALRHTDYGPKFLEILGDNDLVYCQKTRLITFDPGAAATRRKSRKSRLDAELRRQAREAAKAAAAVLATITDASNVSVVDVQSLIDSTRDALVRAIALSLIPGPKVEVHICERGARTIHDLTSSVLDSWRAFQKLCVDRRLLDLQEVWINNHPTYKVLQVYREHQLSADASLLTAVQTLMTIYEWHAGSEAHIP